MMDVGSFTTKMMTGLAVLGDAMRLSPNAVAAVITGRLDTELKCALYMRQSLSYPEVEADIDHPEVLAALERLKEMLRAPIRRAFELEAERIQLEKQEERLARFRSANQPHEMGTVAEIAAKYGITKAEVRRRKAAGTLHELRAA